MAFYFRSVIRIFTRALVTLNHRIWHELKVSTNVVQHADCSNQQPGGKSSGDNQPLLLDRNSQQIIRPPYFDHTKPMHIISCQLLN